MSEIPSFVTGVRFPRPNDPGYAAAVAAEEKARPRSLPKPGPLSPAEIKLHAARGQAVRAVRAAHDLPTKQAAETELGRINAAIKSAELERRVTALENNRTPAHMRNLETR